MNRTIRFGGGWAALLFGAVALLVVLSGYRKANATGEWPAVKGTVVSMEIRKKSDGFVRWRLGHKQQNEHEAIVRYSYVVGGGAYESGTHHLGRSGRAASLSGSRRYLEDVLRVAERYDAGKAIDVYYDPKQPSRAVLATGYHGSLPIELLFVALLLGSGIVGIVRGR